MKKILVFLLSAIFPFLHARIAFSDRNATVRVNNGGSFIVNNLITGWDGTLARNDGALVTGDLIVFEKGVLASGGTESLLTGYYQGDSAETIYLVGSSRIRAEPGVLMPAIQVSTSDNSIEGQPVFSGEITFDGNPATSLNLALQSVLNKNVNINGGTIILRDDLHFSDDATILGEGMVDLNFRSLHFAPYDLLATHTLFFENASDLNFHSRIDLSSSYIFNGQAFINGHGNVLDLELGGRIVIRPNTQVYLSDVFLRGFGSGEIIFTDTSSMLFLSNVQVELDEGITTTIGRVVVNGDTTFILKDWSWSFTNQAKITVDGATLWLDLALEQSGAMPGTLNIPHPIYLDHVWSLSNESEGRALGNFSLVQNGTVKEMGIALTVTDTAANECILVRAPVVASVLMKKNCDVDPVKKIDIRESITIDGQGARITFSNPGTPEFIIAPGKTVRLQNVSLFRINGTTFSFGDGSVLEIGKDVLFECSDDVNFTGDFIKVFGSEIDPNVFTIRGLGAQRRLVIDPIYQDTPGGPIIVKTFDMGLATVVLENIEFKGLPSVNVSRVDTGGGIFVGAFDLFDSGTVDIDVNSDMSFFIEGASSLLKFLQSNLFFSGFLNFSSQFDTTLHMKFDLGAKIATSPVLNIADDSIFLASELGRSRLIFDDYAVTLNLLGSNSFVTDVHSFLGGQNLAVLNFPIKQSSVDLILASGLRLTSNLRNAIDSSFARSFVRSGHRERPVKMAITVLRERQQKKIEKSLELKQAKYGKVHPYILPGLQKADNDSQVLKKQPVAKAHKDKRKNKQLTREPEDIDFMTRAISTEETFVEVTGLTLTDILGSSVKIGEVNGDNKIQNGTGTGFGISTSTPPALRLWMLGNARLEQGANDVVWKKDDKIYVRGENNTILVTKKMTFNGNIVFDGKAGARLIFEFDNNAADPQIIFNSVDYNTLFVTRGSYLEFRGRGTVWFADGKKIQLQWDSSTKERSSFVLADGAMLRLGAGVIAPSTMTIAGVGNCLVNNGGMIVVERDQHLIFGTNTTDNINFVVDQSGVVSVGDSLFSDLASTTLNKGYISFIKATYNLSFDQEGTLRIGKGGVFAINALGSKTSDRTNFGTLESLNFGDGGWMWLDTDGRFVLGNNKTTKGVTPVITFNSKYGSMQGDGVVELAGTQFAGRPCTWVPTRATYSSQELVRWFINRKRTLMFSTFFVDADNKPKLFNKNIDLYGKNISPNPIIDLFVDDEIRSDDVSSGQVYGINGGELFTIMPDTSRG